MHAHICRFLSISNPPHTSLKTNAQAQELNNSPIQGEKKLKVNIAFLNNIHFLL